MKKQDILQKVERHIQTLFKDEETGHDWWHMDRVRRLALHIGRKEGADLFITELGALLHDIADFKFHDGDDTLGYQKTTHILRPLGADVKTIERVAHIVDHVSFKGLKTTSKISSLEGEVVQDADRLDALGAIGIARVFAYGGAQGRLLYDPDQDIATHKTFEEYKKGSASSFHHFYEKILHIRDLMNTETGRAIAEERHRFVGTYIQQFLGKWNEKF